MADIRVGALDHHLLMLQAVETCLNAAPGITVVGTASEAISARRLIGRLKPDVVVLDLDLPDGSSIELARQICTVVPEMAVLATSERPSPLNGRLLMSLGIRGYVSNAGSPERLVADVRSVAAGESVFAAEATPGLAHGLEPLTARELEVLHRLAAAEPTTRIAAELGIVPRTVEYHLTNLYSKLGASSRAEAIAHAQRLGLITALTPGYFAIPNLRVSVRKT